VLDIETVPEPFLGKCIGVQGDDVLETVFLSLIAADLKCIGYLPLIDTVKEVAIVD